MQSTTTTHSAGDLPGHRHHQSHVSLVVDGEYLEHSIDGTYACRPHMLIAHPRFHWHRNQITKSRAKVINIECVHAARYGVYSLSARDSRRILRGKSGGLVLRILDGGVSDEAKSLPGWVSELARSLTTDPTASIQEHAVGLKLSPAHVSRAFSKATGLTPSQHRRESRVRLVLIGLRGDEALVDLSSRLGYSDQSHMGREVREVTGLSPLHIKNLL